MGSSAKSGRVKQPDKSQKLVQFKQKGELPENLDVDFPEDIRVDHLAELGALIVGKFWQKYTDQVVSLLKKSKKVSRYCYCRGA